MDLLAMNTFHKTNIGNVSHRRISHIIKEVTSVDVDNQIRLKDLLLNLFSQESYHISQICLWGIQIKVDWFTQE